MKRFLLLVLFLILAPSAHAQSLAISLAPHEYEVTSKPGNEITLPYTFTNTGDPTVFRVGTYLVTTDPSDGKYQLVPYYSDNPMMPTFSTSSETFPLDEPFLLSSNEAAEFDIVISVGEKMNERDYYFAVVVESEPAEGFEDANRVLLQGGAGSMIYLTVTSNAVLENEASVTIFDVKGCHEIAFFESIYHLCDSFSEIPVVLHVGNTGRNAVTVNGSILSRTLWGTDPETILLPKTRVLSESTRLLQAPSDRKNHNENESTRIKAGFLNKLVLEEYLIIGTTPADSPQRINILVFPITASIIGVVIIMVAASFFLLIKYVRSRAE
ncbi:hypothetical protein KBD81_04240 [Candidatus Woesebacteria bacterium]|nr:hypothetical protein [Candidatus Woesebacteria bacterium]